MYVLKSSLILFAVSGVMLCQRVDAGTLLVSYSNNTVHQFDSLTGADLGTFTSTPAPSGIGFDVLTTAVYVASYGNGNVRKFSATGTDLGVFASGLSGPSGVTVDSLGNVYVANYTGSSISKFSPAGASLGTFSTGAFFPDSLVYDASSGTLLVNYYTGGTGGEIHRFSLAGADLGTVAGGLSNPLPITVDSIGNIYIYEWTGGTLKKFSSGGTLLGSVVTPQSYGLAINENNVLLSAQLFATSIERYNLSLTDLGLFAPTGGPNPSYMTIIPEPSRTVLVALGVGALIFRRRKAA